MAWHSDHAELSHTPRHSPEHFSQTNKVIFPLEQENLTTINSKKLDGSNSEA